jgi:hypothetical protein
MKQNINEIKRMQQLAGIIKEFVDDIHPDDRKSSIIDMYLSKYVKQALGMGENEIIGTHPNSDCIDAKWEATESKLMATDWNKFSETYIKQVIKDANFEECDNPNGL